MELTDDDNKRISAIDEYVNSKRIIEACERNKEYEVGIAVFIKDTHTNTYVRDSYACYSDKNSKMKYVIVKNDNGFVFGKRVGTSGTLGKAIECLTTRYSRNGYVLEVDSEYADAFLLDEKYDPLAQSKALKKLKNKCSSYNKKIKLSFSSREDAYQYIQTLKPGDKLWQCGYSYGTGVQELTVLDINKRKIDKLKLDYWGYSADKAHKDINVEDVYLAKIKSTNKHFWSSSTNSKDHICFYDLYRAAWYTKKPMSPEDFNE